MIEDDFEIKKKVEEVLNETGFTDQRAAKMGVDELLKYSSQIISATYLSLISQLLYTDYSRLSMMSASTLREDSPLEAPNARDSKSNLSDI